MRPIVLASASPRRLSLLRSYFPNLSQTPADIDEESITESSPVKLVETLAREKARVVDGRVEDRQSILISSDTIVCLYGEILGKPRDLTDATEMLSKLSGNEHTVITGVCLYDCALAESHVFSVETRVLMRNLSAEEIAWYVTTKEPLDKAGSYGIQGLAASFVEKIEGSYSNVVGLPLAQLHENLCQRFGFGLHSGLTS